MPIPNSRLVGGVRAWPSRAVSRPSPYALPGSAPVVGLLPSVLAVRPHRGPGAHATGIAAAIQQQQQQQQQQLAQFAAWGYYRQQAGLAASSAAIPAAPSQDEVAIVGYRSRQERDAEARRHAIDVDSESETTPVKRPACAAEVAARPAKPVAKLIAKPAVRLRAKPVAKPAARPATRLGCKAGLAISTKPVPRTPAGELGGGGGGTGGGVAVSHAGGLPKKRFS